MNDLVAYMKMIGDMGWSTVIQLAWNANAIYPVLKRLVGTPERAVAQLTRVSVAIL